MALMCFCSVLSKAEETQRIPSVASVPRKPSSESDKTHVFAQVVIKKKIKFIGERFKLAPTK